MNVQATSNTIDWRSPMDVVNMYGCAPCPWCGGSHRAGFKKTETIDCDDCGFSVPYDMKDEELSQKDNGHG